VKHIAAFILNITRRFLVYRNSNALQQFSINAQNKAAINTTNEDGQTLHFMLEYSKAFLRIEKGTHVHTTIQINRQLWQVTSAFDKFKISLDRGTILSSVDLNPTTERLKQNDTGFLGSSIIFVMLKDHSDFCARCYKDNKRDNEFSESGQHFFSRHSVRDYTVIIRDVSIYWPSRNTFDYTKR
jgi:hypothetical protein